MSDTEQTLEKPVSQPLHLGLRFKNARENLQLDIPSVASQLRVQVSVIEMLETQCFNQNIPSIFIWGYLRSYAKLLHFSEIEIAAMLTELQGTIPQHVKSVTLATSPIQPVKKHWQWMTYAVILVSIIMICLLLNTYVFTSHPFYLQQLHSTPNS